MPIECDQLEGAAVPLPRCPKCGAEPFEPFLRGMVQRTFAPIQRLKAWWRGEPFRYCALICWKCKDIVGYE